MSDAAPRHGVQPPRRFAEATLEMWAQYREAKAAQDRDDIAFARDAGFLITEGPWEGGAPAQEVAYLGIDASGSRVKLPGITNHWRFSPFIGSNRSGASKGELFFRVSKPDQVMVRRIQLSRILPGLVLQRPGGNSPVQGYGWVDGKELYFRSRGTHWSVDIGTDDAIGNSEWYHEEYYGEWPSAGRITSEEAESFIIDAVEKFRSGVPTMTNRTVDAGSASILTAIKSITGK